MRFNVLIYPEGLEIIKELNIAEKVQEIERYRGVMYRRDIAAIFKDLNEKGLYRNLSKEYLAQLQAMFSNPETFSWKIMRGKETLEPCELEDIMFFSGEYSSLLLPAEEIWMPHGCLSGTAFASLVTAFVNSKNNLRRNGYEWTSRRGNQQIVTEVTGDMNGDLVVTQKDITPYETFDPFGNKILFRPEMDDDLIAGICPGHSTEGGLLVAVLKYIHQMEIPLNRKELIDYSQSLRVKGGFWADGDNSRSPDLLFMGFDEYPLMDVSDDRTIFGVCQYRAFLSEGDLVFLNESRERARFKPEDANELVKGLIYQSTNGLGRTPGSRIMKNLEYYFKKFGKDE